jgi:hypothetical protein
MARSLSAALWPSGSADAGDLPSRHGPGLSGLTVKCCHRRLVCTAQQQLPKPATHRPTARRPRVAVGRDPEQMHAAQPEQGMVPTQWCGLKLTSVGSGYPQPSRLSTVSASSAPLTSAERTQVRLLISHTGTLGVARGQLVGTALLLDQLGGIWEITSAVTVPKPLPTGLKRSF